MVEIRALVVEDNPLHAERLELLLENLGVTVQAVVDNALDALDCVYNDKLDFALLDIHLAHGQSGVELAETIRKRSNLPLIFISSDRDRDTFERAVLTRPEAYLYKPIDQENLASAIELVLHRLHHTPDETPNLHIPSFLFVRVGNVLKKLASEEVVYVEVSSKNYCDIRTAHQRFSIKSSLTDLENLLPSKRFMRVSRSHIVNLEKIISINERDQTIETGLESVPVGNAYKQNLYSRIRLL
ncbi:MAG: LytR/AlgR family response regulator transcription factor [Salibacteraceae bacterium]